MKYTFLFIVLFCSTVAAQVKSAPDWQVNPAQYEFTASVIAKVRYNNGALPEGSVILGAFSGSTLHGKTTPITVGSEKLFFLTVYLNSFSETISFKVYVGGVDSILVPAEQLTVAPNGVYGSVGTPVTINVYHLRNISLSAPNGGESWLNGTQQTITWSAAGMNSVKIEYSSDNGTTWSTIAASVTASAEQYVWTLNVTPSVQGRIRVTDTESPMYDISNAAFTVVIAAPALQAQTGVTPSSVQLHWTAVTGASGYRLDVCTSPLFSSGFVTGYENKLVNTIQETVTGLSSDVTYYYRVRAAGPNGTGANTARDSVQLPAQITEQSVEQSGTVNVSVTGVPGLQSIYFLNVVLPGSLLLQRFNSSPKNQSLTGIVPSYRWTLQAQGEFAFDAVDGFSIRFAVAGITGIAELPEGNSSTYTLYRRAQTGSGSFVSAGALTYHNNGTGGNTADDYLESAVLTSGLGEFVFTQSAAASVSLTALLEARFNGTSMLQDTITVSLRRSTAPYTVITENNTVFSSSGTGTVSLNGVPDGEMMYIVLKHRNSIEVWSAAPQVLAARIVNYNFTDAAAKAYGNNLKLKSGKWCIPAGEVTGNDWVEFDDVVVAYNQYRTDPGTGVSLLCDFDGNGFVEFDDVVLVYNRYREGAMVHSPLSTGTSDRVHKKPIKSFPAGNYK